MLYAVIADLHSNIEALSSVLEYIGTLHVDRIICLGDMTGYNADPGMTIDLLRREGVECLLGNHDSRVCGFKNMADFNASARIALNWTRRNINREQLDFLRKLPETLRISTDIIAVHGSLNYPDRYIMAEADALNQFHLMENMPEVPSICFFGHTHKPALYSLINGKLAKHTDSVLTMKRGGKYLINPGSVGQPRNNDPRSSFAFYDSSKMTLRFVRKSYNTEKCRRKIIKAGLPPDLAERLKLGK